MLAAKKPRPRKPKPIPAPPIPLEGSARLEAVAAEVQAFFGTPDRDQPLRYLLASEHLFAWLEQMGAKIERPFNMQQMCDSFLAWTGPLPIGMPVRK